MNKQNKLVLERSIFVFIIFVVLGVIVFTEKFGDVLIPKITKKMDNYIEEKYSDIEKDIIKNEVTFKNTTYTMKVESKENKNHYFYITYFNKKITDTYEIDYVEGKVLLNYLKTKIEKEIKDITNTNCEIEITSPLNKYTSTIQKRIIKEDNLLSLKFYKIKKELIISNWNEKEITTNINNLIEKFNKNNITPKSYTIIITNKNDITESIQINNLTSEFINNSSSEEIISDIINNKKSDLLDTNKITYKYLN